MKVLFPLRNCLRRCYPMGHLLGTLRVRFAPLGKPSRLALRMLHIRVTAKETKETIKYQYEGRVHTASERIRLSYQVKTRMLSNTSPLHKSPTKEIRRRLKFWRGSRGPPTRDVQSPRQPRRVKVNTRGCHVTEKSCAILNDRDGWNISFSFILDVFLRRYGSRPAIDGVNYATVTGGNYRLASVSV